MARVIGVHLRLTDTLLAMAQQAIRLNIASFQCFLIKQQTERYIKPTKEEIAEFLVFRDNFTYLYLHGAYWINLVRADLVNYRMLMRELRLAEQLQFSHCIIHPGSVKGSDDRLQGIDILAKSLNRLCKQDIGLQLVLENTAYAGMTIGSDLNDFALLRTKLDQAEKIKFCIDTAHAHAYGYDIINAAGQQQFVQLLDKAIGIENIVVLHVNDTKERCGSYIDRHDIPGTGVIGVDALKQLVNNPQLKHIPLLLELPVMPEDDMKRVIDEVKKW